MDRSKDFITKSLYENRFWLEILRDHAVFVLNTLSPVKERDNIHKSIAYINVLTERIEEVDRLKAICATEEVVAAMNSQNYTLAVDFRNYQQHLLDKHLICELDINMTPTFLEHMVREDEEYIRVLTLLQQGITELHPAAESIHQNMLWLPDAAGHAAAIKCDLDMTEKKLIKKADEFEKTFLDLFFKTYELQEMILPYPRMLPVLQRHNLENAEEIACFVEYLKYIKCLVEECRILNAIMPLMPDHMIREELYYLQKLREAGTPIALPIVATDVKEVVDVDIEKE